MRLTSLDEVFISVRSLNTMSVERMGSAEGERASMREKVYRQSSCQTVCRIRVNHKPDQPANLTLIEG